jgi:hypothetical protein
MNVRAVLAAASLAVVAIVVVACIKSGTPADDGHLAEICHAGGCARNESGDPICNPTGADGGRYECACTDRTNAALITDSDCQLEPGQTTAYCCALPKNGADGTPCTIANDCTYYTCDCDGEPFQFAACVDSACAGKSLACQTNGCE